MTLPSPQEMSKRAKRAVEHRAWYKEDGLDHPMGVWLETTIYPGRKCPHYHAASAGYSYTVLWYCLTAEEKELARALYRLVSS